MENLIDEKDLLFLTELGKKMNAQNNRNTQYPTFVIKQKVKVYKPEECCSETERIDEFDDELLCEKCSALYENDEELPDYCKDCDPDLYVCFDWEDETVENCGTFFTAEAAEEHIRLNDYHYYKPFTYAIGTWRNFEMQKVLEILSKLGNGGEALTQYK